MDAEEKQEVVKPAAQPERETPRWRPTEVEELKHFFPSPEERERLKQRVIENDRAAGIPDEPTMTLGELRASLIARGIRPEDNIGSRDLLKMRYGDEWDKE